MVDLDELERKYLTNCCDELSGLASLHMSRLIQELRLAREVVGAAKKYHVHTHAGTWVKLGRALTAYEQLQDKDKKLKQQYEAIGEHSKDCNCYFCNPQI